jgi:integrase
MRCTSAAWPRPLRRRLEDRAMTDNTLVRSISGGAEVAAPLEIAAPGGLYAVGFLRRQQQSASRAPSGRETARRGRPLTKTEEEESIIINRPDRSTYPEQELSQEAEPPLTYRHGLRVSELVALRWSQVELKAGLLHVTRRKNGSPRPTPCRVMSCARCGSSTSPPRPLCSPRSAAAP